MLSSSIALRATRCCQHLLTPERRVRLHSKRSCVKQRTVDFTHPHRKKKKSVCEKTRWGTNSLFSPDVFFFFFFEDNRQSDIHDLLQVARECVLQPSCRHDFERIRANSGQRMERHHFLNVVVVNIVDDVVLRISSCPFPSSPRGSSIATVFMATAARVVVFAVCDKNERCHRSGRCSISMGVDIESLFFQNLRSSPSPLCNCCIARFPMCFASVVPGHTDGRWTH